MFHADPAYAIHADPACATHAGPVSLLVYDSGNLQKERDVVSRNIVVSNSRTFQEGSFLFHWPPGGGSSLRRGPSYVVDAGQQCN